MPPAKELPPHRLQSWQVRKIDFTQLDRLSPRADQIVPSTENPVIAFFEGLLSELASRAEDFGAQFFAVHPMPAQRRFATVVASRNEGAKESGVIESVFDTMGYGYS